MGMDMSIQTVTIKYRVETKFVVLYKKMFIIVKKD